MTAVVKFYPDTNMYLLDLPQVIDLHQDCGRQPDAECFIGKDTYNAGSPVNFAIEDFQAVDGPHLVLGSTEKPNTVSPSWIFFSIQFNI